MRDLRVGAVGRGEVGRQARDLDRRQRARVIDRRRELADREAEAAHPGVDLEVNGDPPAQASGGGRESVEVAGVIDDGGEPFVEDVVLMLVVERAEHDDRRPDPGRA